jgi:hypothetical protein
VFTSANQAGLTVQVPESFTLAAGPFVDTITMTDATGTPFQAIDGLFLTDHHNGTATLHGVPNQVAKLTIKFTASNSNVNAADRAASHIPYTATQTFTLAILP